MINNEISISSSILDRDFKVEETLGSGKFGQIVKARRFTDSNEFAIKIVKFETYTDDVGIYEREARNLSKLDHKNIVRYYNSWVETAKIPYLEDSDIEFVEDDGVSTNLSSEITNLSKKGYISWNYKNSESSNQTKDDEEDKESEDSEVAEKEGKKQNEKEHEEEGSNEQDSQITFCSSAESIKEFMYLIIQMELCDKRNLRNEIQNSLYLDESKLTKYLKQICKGLSHIHQNGIVHRDLKPENILLTPMDIIKIADFGLSKQIAKTAELVPADLLYYGSLSDLCGTPTYIAPELYDSKEITLKADIYALGVIYFEMCSAPMTWMETSLHLKSKLKDVTFVKNNNMKKSLIKILLYSHYKERPTCDQILKILKSNSDNTGKKKILPNPMGSHHLNLNKLWNFEKDFSDKLYKINPKNPGLCVIINQESFYGSDNILRDRKGSEIDEDNLVTTFEKFRFEVKKYKNLSDIEIVKVVTDVALNITVESILFICILSHGYEGAIYGANGRSVKVRHIQNLMCCNNLLWKPKILLLQSCQTSDEPWKVIMKNENDAITSQLETYVTSDGSCIKTCNDNELDAAIMASRNKRDHGNKKITPPLVDLLTFWATVPGYPAYRNTITGSWFIQSFCKKMCELGDKHHLEDICTAVTRDVCNKRAELNINNASMTPLKDSTFTKFLFLHPIQHKRRSSL